MDSVLQIRVNSMLQARSHTKTFADAEFASKNALYWCAGSWILKKVELGLLRKTQQRIVCKMLGTRPQPDEDIASYMQ